MALAFKTPDDSPASVEITNVGHALAFGENVIDLAIAALNMRELQDENGKPLKGDALKAAAEAWVENKLGLELKNVAASKLAAAAPPEPPEQPAPDEPADTKDDTSDTTSAQKENSK